MSTYVYLMFGLGNGLWSGGMETVLGAGVRTIPGVICPPTYNYYDWKDIVDAIKKQPKGSKTVVCGHSLGASSATYITDYVYVDLLVLYDLAGRPPSKLGKNTGRCIDIYDTIPDLVPEWRVEAIKGHEKKIDRWYSQHGHTGQDDSLDLMNKVVSEIKKLNIKE